MSTFRGSLPIPKYDIETVVAHRQTENENMKYGVIEQIHIIWIDKKKPEIRYKIVSYDYLWPEENLKYEVIPNERR